MRPYDANVVSFPVSYEIPDETAQRPAKRIHISYWHPVECPHHLSCIEISPVRGSNEDVYGTPRCTGVSHCSRSIVWSSRPHNNHRPDQNRQRTHVSRGATHDVEDGAEQEALW